jgi:lysophospholipase L1-like esterase
LQKLLGNGYWVKNFGISGSTMAPSENTFMQRDRWQHALQFQPDIVFIKLGTNDIKPSHWKGDEAFTTAYQHMIDTLRALPSKPRIVLCLPATSYRKDNHLDSDITGKAIPLIRQVAKKNKLDVIDLHTPTSGQPERFPDQLHPDAQGAGIIAQTIYNYLKTKK